jgi:plasmid stabilization system protein ParE
LSFDRRLGKTFLDNIGTYLLEQDAEAAAERFLDAARAAIEYVFRRPRVGTPKVFREDALMGLRSWPVKGFLAVRIYYLASKRRGSDRAGAAWEERY